MRALVRRTPISLRVFDPLEEFEGLARRLWDAWEFPEFVSTFPSAMDVHEENNELVIKTELPGMTRKEVEINLKENVLTVTAEQKDKERGEYHRYHRSMLLPKEIDAEKASAIFDNGLLEIRFPKALELETKHIEVKTLKKPKSKAKAPKSNNETKARKAKSKSK